MKIQARDVDTARSLWPAGIKLDDGFKDKVREALALTIHAIRRHRDQMRKFTALTDASRECKGIVIVDVAHMLEVADAAKRGVANKMETGWWFYKNAVDFKEFDIAETILATNNNEAVSVLLLYTMYAESMDDVPTGICTIPNKAERKVKYDIDEEAIAKSIQDGISANILTGEFEGKDAIDPKDVEKYANAAVPSALAGLE